MAKKKRKYPELKALKGKIREKGTSYRKLALKLGIATNTLSDKINGFYPFIGPEMEIIADELDIEPASIVVFFMPAYCETHQKYNQSTDRPA